MQLSQSSNLDTVYRTKSFFFMNIYIYIYISWYSLELLMQCDGTLELSCDAILMRTNNITYALSRNNNYTALEGYQVDIFFISSRKHVAGIH